MNIKLSWGWAGLLAACLCALAIAAGIQRRERLPFQFDDGHGFTVTVTTNGFVTQRGTRTPVTNAFGGGGGGGNFVSQTNGTASDLTIFDNLYFDSDGGIFGNFFYLDQVPTPDATNTYKHLVLGSSFFVNGYAFLPYGVFNYDLDAIHTCPQWLFYRATNSVDVTAAATNQLEVSIGGINYYVPAALKP